MPFRASKDRVVLDGVSLNEGASASVASAATIDIWSGTGNLVPISGTASISAFTAAPQAGAKRTLLCTSTPTFVHGANFILPGSVNYTATAGDKVEVIAVTATQFRLFAHEAEHTAMGLTGGGSLGTYLDTTALEAAYPAVENAGNSAVVGTTAPYETYVSDGAIWAVRSEKYRIQKVVSNWGATMIMGRWQGATAGATRQALHQVDVAEAPFDAVQFAFPNGTATECAINGAVFCLVSRANVTPIYSGTVEGTQVCPTPWSANWTDVTFSGASSSVTPANIPAQAASLRPGWLLSDVMKLVNPDPLTDAASLTGNPAGLPLMLSRIQCNAGNKDYSRFASTGYDSAPEWDQFYASNYGQGRIHNAAFITSITAGRNYATTSSIFHWVSDGRSWTSFDGIAYVPKFRHQGKCIQILGIGDSLTAGSSEMCANASPEFRACVEVSTQDNPVAYLNGGLSGSGFAISKAYADDLMPVFDPDVIIISAGSPNDAGSWGSLVGWDNQWISVMDYLNSSTVKDSERLVILATLCPYADPATWDPVNNIGHQGWLRHYNRCLALADRGYIVWDRAAPVSEVGNVGKWISPLCNADASIPVARRSSNWYHPSEAGIQLQVPSLTQILRNIVATNF